MDIALEHNHVALLQHQAKTSGNTVLLKLPVQNGSEPPQTWNNVTVADFYADVERVANYLVTELHGKGIPPHSVITLLYDERLRNQDLAYAIALGRATYIPQMCTDRLTHPEIIFDLMKKADSKMILYDPSLEHLTENCPFPKMPFTPIESIKSTSSADSTLPQVEDLASSSDVAFVFLTSGSTSGSPKLVPLTQKVLNFFYKVRFGRLFEGQSGDAQNALLARGNICHLPSMIEFLGCVYTKSCLVQPSRRDYTPEELSRMVNVCGLNHMTTYGTYLSPYIQAAKQDPSILKLLQEMRTVSYDGVPITVADDDWCLENDIPMIDMYAATEMGYVMSTVPGKAGRFVRPLPGISCRFDPVTDASLQVNPDAPQLVEFVVLSDSPQIAPPHLRSADGNFHTGDLFEQQPDGSYLYRGRDDDWIKSYDSDRTDAKAIEEKIYDSCRDIVKECAVVGHLRPSPALFVAAAREVTFSSEDELREAILKRLEVFNARQYVHEAITDKRLIFVVEEGVLPRTLKGNIRRKAIEQKYSKELDVIFKEVYGDY
ncbi:hypothetical protein CPB83DRAFT_852255 [Crepidotus variabilis]|uniref:AMP-dependent synthetase/ligase domain-containing protein n=1 Tax=Crepidotus variabilis TaxID=179855 RepID=A0A9P6EIK7_9AGAR|nr:hypothetical protein CPB83DRAFT_852255 [Crepidotus variabilis]